MFKLENHSTKKTQLLMKSYNIEKSYNKFRHKYRVERANPDTKIWSAMFFDKDVVDNLHQFNFSTGTFIFRLKPYRFYFLRSFFWFFMTLIYQNPIAKLDKQSKRHMTIVLLMILTIIVMFYIAYSQGVFLN